MHYRIRVFITAEFSGSMVVDKSPKGYGFDFDNLSEIEIILRPLSDLKKEIEHNGEKFVPIERIMDMYGIVIMVDSQKQLIAPITLEPYNAIRQLFEWHFDVFGLIAQGLAVDINTVKEASNG